jgi:hypothetical protein
MHTGQPCNRMLGEAAGLSTRQSSTRVLGVERIPAENENGAIVSAVGIPLSLGNQLAAERHQLAAERHQLAA